MTNFYILGTPDEVRKYLPAFDRPIQNAPWLVFIFDDSHAFVIERGDFTRLIGGMVGSMDSIISKIELVAPEDA